MTEQQSTEAILEEGSTHDRGRIARRAWAGVGALLGSLTLLALAGCNEYGFYQPGPAFRGITIPIPPPSLVEAPEIEIDVDGSVPEGTGGGTEVYLYESVSGRGYFTVADADSGDFVIEEVDVNLEENCIRLWYVDGADGEQSDDTFYKAYIETDPEVCADETMKCSAVDEQGACACLDEWSVGC